MNKKEEGTIGLVAGSVCVDDQLTEWGKPLCKYEETEKNKGSKEQFVYIYSSFLFDFFLCKLSEIVYEPDKVWLLLLPLHYVL